MQSIHTVEKHPHKKEWSTDSHEGMADSWKHCKREKSNVEDRILCVPFIRDIHNMQTYRYKVK